MFIIVDTNNIVKYITKSAERDTNSSNIIWVDHHKLMFCEDPDYPVHVYEINNMPSNIRVDEYCYDISKGFYENESYQPPLDTDVLADLIKSRNNLQTQIAELSANLDYMSMVASVELPDSEEE